MMSDAFDYTSGAVIATAGSPTQLIITPYDNYGNRANVTTVEAYRITVESSTRIRRRHTLESTDQTSSIDVSPACLEGL